jgi:cysteine-rich repeat protein
MRWMSCVVMGLLSVGCSSICGDGDIENSEQCDDGNNTDGDGCSRFCVSEQLCGDGIIDEGEECDLGAQNSDTGACTLSCSLPVCGDTFVQAGEECDDGNQNAADGCDQCLLVGACGDGIAEGEFCGFQDPDVFTSDAQSVVLVDINNDTNLDLVFLKADPANVFSILGVFAQLGNGDGTFGAEQTLLTSPLFDRFQVLDINTDGEVDLVLGSLSTVNGESSFGLLFGNGDGTFGALQSSSLEGGFLFAVDTDNDTNVDIIALADVGNGDGLSVSLGDGLGGFAAPIFSEVAASLSVTEESFGDIDGDGVVDVALMNNLASTLHISLGDGAGSFTTTTTARDLDARAVVLQDVDADGLSDLLISNIGFDSTISVLLSEGDGTFTEAPSVSIDFAFGRLVAADINGDQSIDLVNPGIDHDVFLGLGGGVFGAPIVIGTDLSSGGDVVIGDLNGDNAADMVTSNAQEISILLGESF